jgi:hypothetical protein
VRFSVFIAGLRGRLVLRLCPNLKVTSQILVLKPVREVIVGASHERLTFSITSAPFITENEVVCINGEGDKNCSYNLEKYCKTYDETCELDSDRTKCCEIHFPEVFLCYQKSVLW